PPDAKNSSVYLFEINQGGLGLPDRDYYFNDNFAKTRDSYREHITKMFTLLGDEPEAAASAARAVIGLETAMADASRTRVALRDPNANYNNIAAADFARTNSSTRWNKYFAELPNSKFKRLNVGQPEYFTALD